MTDAPETIWDAAHELRLDRIYLVENNGTRSFSPTPDGHDLIVDGYQRTDTIPTWKNISHFVQDGIPTSEELRSGIWLEGIDEDGLKEVPPKVYTFRFEEFEKGDGQWGIWDVMIDDWYSLDDYKPVLVRLADFPTPTQGGES